MRMPSAHQSTMLSWPGGGGWGVGKPYVPHRMKAEEGRGGGTGSAAQPDRRAVESSSNDAGQALSRLVQLDAAVHPGRPQLASHPLQ